MQTVRLDKPLRLLFSFSIRISNICSMMALRHIARIADLDVKRGGVKGCLAPALFINTSSSSSSTIPAEMRTFHHQKTELMLSVFK